MNKTLLKEGDGVGARTRLSCGCDIKVMCYRCIFARGPTCALAVWPHAANRPASATSDKRGRWRCCDGSKLLWRCWTRRGWGAGQIDHFRLLRGRAWHVRLLRLLLLVLATCGQLPHGRHDPAQSRRSQTGQCHCDHVTMVIHRIDYDSAHRHDPTAK